MYFLQFQKTMKFINFEVFFECFLLIFGKNDPTIPMPLPLYLRLNPLCHQFSGDRDPYPAERVKNQTVVSGLMVEEFIKESLSNQDSEM